MAVSKFLSNVFENYGGSESQVKNGKVSGLLALQSLWTAFLEILSQYPQSFLKICRYALLTTWMHMS
jgi:hypothetical protein